MQTPATGVTQALRGHRRHAAQTGVWAAWLAALALPAGMAHAREPGDAARCARLPDDAARLACYDTLFRPGPVLPPGVMAPGPAAVSDGRAEGEASEPAAALPGVPPERQPLDPAQVPPAATLLEKAWELTPEEKRGTFAVKTYLPNFVLPAHISTDINRAPSSPTRGLAPSRVTYKPLEVKVQVSLRAKVAEGLLLRDADLWFAYTQRSMWQLWNTRESAPFRNTDHEPEMIYVVPMARHTPALPGGWQWRMLQLGLQHQSNGQSDALSRSWNRFYAHAALDSGPLAVSLRLYRRLRESARDDDNPDIQRYLGNAELTAAWVGGPSTVSLAWRTHLPQPRRGAWQLDWTYPVHRDRPAGLRWYLQLFSGHGETLLDYNHRHDSLGVGLSLFQF